MNKKLAKILSVREMPLNFIRFYTVGILLFMLPATRNFFISIISFSLLLVFGVLFCYHREWRGKTICWFVFIVVSSFLLEMYGVNTGKIFGAYQYDRGLGFQINGTPLLIGLNWLFLTYATHDIAAVYFGKPVLRIIGGAALMIFYDLMMEIVAPVMGMWHFTNAYPPLSNFLAWLGVSLLYHTGFEVFKIRADNYPARMLYWIQLVFFMFIACYSLIIVPKWS